MIEKDKKRKGILLAGGNGTRLHPLTAVTCKQLLPVYDKPMIYYPLSTLMLSGITEILIISTPEATPILERFLGKGERFGLSISYAVQQEPKGIAEAFLIAEEFIGDDLVTLILGDNIFYGAGLYDLLHSRAKSEIGATIFATHVRDPERFGVIEFDAQKKVIDIIEKPENPPSNYATVGLYNYDQNVVQYTKELKPSIRGELEITDLNKRYIQEGRVDLCVLGRGNMWMDVGTPASLLEAGNFIAQIDERQGLKISCPEEIAWRMGYISDEQLQDICHRDFKKGSDYGRYLSQLTQEKAVKQQAIF